MVSDSANLPYGRLWPPSGAWRWLFRQRSNGLPADVWVPVLLVDGRIVTALLAELRRAGIPAYCARFRSGRYIPPPPSRWCVWVSRSTCGTAEEKLAEVLPLLIHSLYRAPIGPGGPMTSR